MVEKPRVSILMGVYLPNSEDLARTVESIFAQTYQRFEFIIVQDDDQQQTMIALQELASRDKRVRLIFNKRNMGLVVSLNRALGMASAPFIARVDVGDAWAPKKLASQVDLLEKEKDLVAVGTQYKNFSTDGILINPLKMPRDDLAIRSWLKDGRNPFIHSAIVFRRQEGILYNENALHTEDFELWCRLSFFGKMQNLATPLTYYFSDPSGISGVKRYLMYANGIQVYERFAANLFRPDRREIREGFKVLPRRRMSFLQGWGARFYSQGQLAAFQGRNAKSWLFFFLAVIVAPGFLVLAWQRNLIKRRCAADGQEFAPFMSS